VGVWVVGVGSDVEQEGWERRRGNKKFVDVTEGDVLRQTL
jgi:hypothetical protein